MVDLAEIAFGGRLSTGNEALDTESLFRRYPSKGWSKAKSASLISNTS